MSAAPKFSIALQVGDAGQSHLWDSAEALSLGHSLPWVLERPADEVRLVHAASGSVFPLDAGLLRSGTEIDLRDPSNQSGLGVMLRIRQVPDLDPVHQNRPDSHESPTLRWHVFALSGGWVLESWPLGSRYRATRNHRTAFVLRERDGRFHVKIKDPEVKLVALTSAGAITPDSRGVYVLTPDQLGRVRFAVEGGVSWKFSLVEHRSASSLRLVAPPADEETRWFRRSLFAFAALFLLTFGSTLLLVKPAEEEKKEEVQFARIVLKKRGPRAESAPAAQDAGGNAPAAPAAPKQPEASQQSAAQSQAQTKPDQVQAPAQEKIAPAQEKIAPAQEKVAPAQEKVAPAQAVARAPKDTPKPAAPAAPVKPKVSQAVLQAQALQSSMAKLMGGMPSSLAVAAGDGGRAKPSAGVFNGRSDALGAVSDGTLAKAGLGGSGHEVVKVGYTGAGNGSPDGDAVGGYGSGVPGGVGVKGGSGSFVSVSIGEAVPSMGEDGLTKKEVWAVINQHMSEVRYCYERATLRRPNVEGRLMLDFVIGANGSVTRSIVKASTLGDSQLDQCISGRLASWKFPKPRGNIDVGVTYPFVFKRL